MQFLQRLIVLKSGKGVGRNFQIAYNCAAIEVFYGVRAGCNSHKTCIFNQRVLCSVVEPYSISGSQKQLGGDLKIKAHKRRSAINHTLCPKVGISVSLDLT